MSMKFEDCFQGLPVKYSLPCHEYFTLPNRQDKDAHVKVCFRHHPLIILRALRTTRKLLVYPRHIYNYGDTRIPLSVKACVVLPRELNPDPV